MRTESKKTVVISVRPCSVRAIRERLDIRNRAPKYEYRLL
jgi:hypothetical protein